MTLANFAQVSTPLGDDVLRLRSMTGREELGRLFAYELELLGPDGDLKLADLLGQPITLHVTLENDSVRHFNGYVSRFARTGSSGRHAIYRATLRPWLWLLTRSTDCRIFQHMSVPDVIKEVFRDHGLTDFDEVLTQAYSPWDYLVQYRESAFNFVSRLMEQTGIYYFFKHEDGKHTLILADDYGAHEPVGGYEEVPYYPPHASERRERDHVDGWRVSEQIQTGAYMLNDFDFKRPKASLQAKLKSPQPKTEFETYDYPGEYTENSDGEFYVRVRLEEQQAQTEQVEGSGNVRGLGIGALFKLTGYPRDDQNREYLITTASYNLHVDEYESGRKGGSGADYRCSFSAIESRTPYRLPRVTPKPTIIGPQTAIVVGKAGEEIWTDEFGRVKVQFHWDRLGKSDENSSCWVRVAQVWAGARWGAMHIPRMGQEVIVEFLEGDPDRPIITGRVYNGDSMPPYDLPANQTQSGLKSRSTKGGNPDNFNELRFEDKKGEEQVYLQAEKNMDALVKAAETLTVGATRTKSIGSDETTTVGGNRTETVSKDEKITIVGSRTEVVGPAEDITIAGTRHEKVGGSETIQIAGPRTESVGGAETITIGAARSTTVMAGDSLKVLATLEVDVLGAHTQNVGGEQSINVVGARSVSVVGSQSTSVKGSNSVSVSGDESEKFGGARSQHVGKDDKLDVGKTLVITAADEIVFKTGDATLTMKKNGDIVIKGKNISVNGSGKIAAKADGDVILKGSKVAQN